jgi:hypothetical protein
MIEAYKFVNKFDNVKRIKYNGQILYNVLMENHRKISVNNLICETLHPKNVIAKLYSSNMNEDYKNKIIFSMNDSIRRGDYVSYKKCVSRI